MGIGARGGVVIVEVGGAGGLGGVRGVGGVLRQEEKLRLREQKNK